MVSIDQRLRKRLAVQVCHMPRVQGMAEAEVGHEEKAGMAGKTAARFYRRFEAFWKFSPNPAADGWAWAPAEQIKYCTSPY